MKLLANRREEERPKMGIAPTRRPMRFTPEPHSGLRFDSAHARLRRSRAASLIAVQRIEASGH